MSITSENPTILAISDLRFLPHLQVLVASVNRHFPQAHIHIYLVNINDPKEQISLKQLHPNIQFTLIEKNLEEAIIKIALDGKTQYTEKAGFCVNLRVHAIHTLLNKGVSNILFVDADTIIRKDLSELFDQLKNSHILIHKRPKEKHFMRVAGGVIAVRNTDWSKSFFKRFIEQVDRLGNTDFFSDQWGFDLTAQELSGYVSPLPPIGHLPKCYIDWDFNEHSFIWVGKGQRKNKNKTYLAERSIYGFEPNRN